MKVGIVYAGVGGQGVLTASSIVGKAALLSGLNVVMSEVHGMAQRGGIVVTEMKIGREVKSPLLGSGEADIVVGFEPVEAYRILHKAHPGSYVVVNTEPIIPTTVSIQGERYPEVKEIIEKMKDLKVISLEATELARQAGDAIATNIVMLGALAKIPVFPIKKETLIEALKSTINPRYHEMNLKAFELGYNASSL